jgi:hypothetical protein
VCVCVWIGAWGSKSGYPLRSEEYADGRGEVPGSSAESDRFCRTDY